MIAMEPIYINSNLVMYRDMNTLYVINEEGGKRAFPIKNVSDIYCLGKVSLKSGAIHLLMNENIPVHFFNMYGGYVGSLMPKDDLISGKVIIAQSSHHIDPIKRMIVARKFVYGTKKSMLKSLRHYKYKGKDVSEFIRKIESVEIKGKTPLDLMGVEGQLWIIYYEAFNKLSAYLKMNNRVYHPPNSELNALISFGNSLLYATVLSELYKTYLHPAISFVHEPLERRYSLCLDIADLFKPLIITRVILNLVNLKKITSRDFNKDLGYYLKEKARIKFIEEYHNMLNTTIRHKQLKRNVSYRYLIRLEAYRLVKHFINDKVYEPLEF